MSQRKRPKRERPNVYEVAYCFEVLDCVTSGSYTSWEPDEIPKIIREEYPEDPKVPVVDVNFDVELAVSVIDPPLPQVTEATFSIHGKRQTPEPPGDPPRRGVLDKRKHVLRGFAFTSLEFARELAAVLYTGRRVLLNVYGAKLFRGKAALGPVYWYDARHDTVEDELSAIAELDGNRRAAEVLRSVKGGVEIDQSEGSDSDGTSGETGGPTAASARESSGHRG